MTDIIKPTPVTGASVYKRDLSFHFPLQLWTGMSKAPSGVHFKPGHFVYNKEKSITEGYPNDLIPCFFVAAQDKAIRFHKGKRTGLSYTCIRRNNEIVGDDMFLEIARGRDNAGEQLRHLWGLEILLYISDPHFLFTQIHFGQTTQRDIAEAFEGMATGQPIFLGSKFVDPENSPYSWYAPTVNVISDPSELPDTFAPPTADRVQDALTKFIRTTEETETAAPDR